MAPEPRIRIPSSFDTEAQEALAGAPHRADGRPLNLFATLSIRPELARRVNALGGYFVLRGTLENRSRELVILRVAGRTGCGYELAHHREAARSLGMDEGEIAAASGAERSSGWDREDAALLEFVDELIDHHAVGDRVWDGLDGVLSAEQRLEVAMLAGFYLMLAGTLNTLRVELDPPADRGI